MNALINQLIDIDKDATVDCRVDAHCPDTVRPDKDRAVDNHERFIVDRLGEPAVVIMSVQDFISAVVPAPQWLQKACADAKKRRMDKLSTQDIDAEIKAYRREKLEKNEKKK